MRLLGHIHRAGTFASLTCAIHCMLTPILIALLPLIGGSFLVNGRFDRWMLLVGVLLPLPDLCWGFRKHRSPSAFILLLCGWGWWWVAHEQRFLWQHMVSVAMCGIAFLWSNLKNRQLCKDCTHCENHTV